MSQHFANQQITVAEAIIHTLEQYQLSAIYGIISIHNLPIADALGQREKIRFIPTRGEAGAVTMADAHARMQGLGVVLTSTGAGAGNAVGGLLEALNAGTPLLHLTGQVETAYLEANNGFIHETKDQLGFLKASCKQAYRATFAEQVIPLLHKAIQQARTLPYGPVSLEIPIDLQNKLVSTNILNITVENPYLLPISNDVIESLYQKIRCAKRPILWIGGGTLACSTAIERLADAGFMVISSTHARGVLSDHHPRNLRAFHNSNAVENILAQSDLILIVGSKLRSNETKTWTLSLPTLRIQVDIDCLAANRNYPVDYFIQADCTQLLPLLADRLAPDTFSSPAWDQQIQKAVKTAEQELRYQAAEYVHLSDALAQLMPNDAIFVRDITVAGSVWGSRLLPAHRPNRNIHSLAGAIGMGLAMAIGIAVSQPNHKVVALVGDGGLMLGIGELATMAQEQLNITLIIMNDNGYGVMRGIQDKYFAGRQYFNQLTTPSFIELGKSMGIVSWQLNHIGDVQSILAQALAIQGPTIIEVDMNAIGVMQFAGPPQKKLY